MDFKNMKKSTIGIIVALVLLFFWGCSSYNGLVDKDESANQAWSDVEASYQRRADLIDNLVNTVKGYTKHESETLKEVTEMRSHAPKITLNAEDLTEENLKKFQEAQEQWKPEYESALSRLIAVSEAYPDLKSAELFQTLQAQIEGTENRINEARKKFNSSVKEYNVSVRRFPNNILAGMFGFDQRASFKADEGAEKAPKVSFD